MTPANLFSLKTMELLQNGGYTQFSSDSINFNKNIDKDIDLSVEEILTLLLTCLKTYSNLTSVFVSPSKFNILWNQMYLFKWASATFSET